MPENRIGFKALPSGLDRVARPIPLRARVRERRRQHRRVIPARHHAPYLPLILLVVLRCRKRPEVRLRRPPRQINVENPGPVRVQQPEVALRARTRFLVFIK